MVCLRDDCEKADFYFVTTEEARTIASDQQKRLGRVGSATECAMLARSPDPSGTMTDTFLLCFALVTVTAACAVAARRLRVPYSIMLVITGIALAFVPGLPKVELDPQVVMLLFLPPLLYMAGVSMSWRGFRDNLRPIALLAVGCVLFTACAVATVAHWAIGLSWGRLSSGPWSPRLTSSPHGDCAAASGTRAHPDHLEALTHFWWSSKPPG